MTTHQQTIIKQSTQINKTSTNIINNSTKHHQTIETNQQKSTPNQQQINNKTTKRINKSTEHQ